MTNRLFVALSALMILVAIPLALRRVPPNRWYGLRIPATFADRDVWYTANARMGRELAWLGAVLLAVALVLDLAPAQAGDTWWRPLVFVAVGVAGGLALTIRGVRHASRLRASRDLEGPGPDNRGR
jgi:SdpI/YhfL family protein